MLMTYEKLKVCVFPPPAILIAALVGLREKWHEPPIFTAPGKFSIFSQTSDIRPITEVKAVVNAGD
jgi:hypothetical protein